MKGAILVGVDHKRPLFAFIVVAVVCGLVFVDALRSQALIAVVRTGVATVVTGAAFVVDRRDQAIPETIPGTTLAAAQGFVPRTDAQRDDAAAPQARSGHGRPASPPGTREDRAGRRHHATTSAPGRSEDHRARGRARGHEPGHQKSGHHGHAHGKAKGHARGKGHHRGHDRHRH